MVSYVVIDAMARHPLYVLQDYVITISDFSSSSSCLGSVWAEASDISDS